MSENKGSYQRTIERYIAEGQKTIHINWINMSRDEAESGGADKCTALLLAAGYRPDGTGIRADLWDNYVNGVKDENGKYLRLAQEEWKKEQ